MDADILSILNAAGDPQDGLVEAATAAQVRQTIIGASTCTAVIPDEGGQVLTSLRGSALPKTALAAGRAYRFVAVNHVASTVRLVFEDAVIAALRSQRDPVMFATALQAGDIIARFATEAGVQADVDPLLAQQYVEGAGRSQLEPTDSWREISSLATRLGGRAFSDGSRLVAMSDAALLERTPSEFITPDTEPLKTGIDFGIDVAKPLERASFTVDTDAWRADAGAVVDIADAGPADGRWLVSVWARWLPATGSSLVQLTRPLTIGG